MTASKMFDGRRIVFMYPGQGSQYFRMGKTLFERDDAFRGSLEWLNRIVEAEIGASLVDYVFDPGKNPAMPFDDTRYSNQAVFCFEYALTQSLLAHGVYPDCVLGASLGELVAACVAGSLSPRTCIAMLADSARTMARTCRPGGMLAVLASPGLFDRDAVLSGNAELASISFDQHFVVAGTAAGMDVIETHLSARGVPTARLPVEYGFHSAAIDPARESLRRQFADIGASRPIVALLSCEKADFVDRPDAAHLDAVLRRPIQFKRAIERLEQQGDYWYVDVSLSGTLATYCKHLLGPYSRSSSVAVATPFSRHESLDPAHWLVGKYMPPTAA
ncbi:acyltransferase domain-containing protein [Burkholderia singularis]|uniref:Polyketide synthase n=1 Tax=Burkholderia singularis TaxID=1503053 RepID=A0A238H4B1_9BURK|nr:acyltransferase domain-containing protein [Burkholderia singularis]SMG00102.1 Polyketide synthase [Burkholderia singularis]